MIAHTLELLLQGAGYRTRLTAEVPPDDLDGFLDGAQILLLVPGSRLVRSRDAILSTLEDRPRMRLPILELVTTFQPADDTREEARRVPWPCPTENLKRRIEEVLLTERGM